MLRRFDLAVLDFLKLSVNGEPIPLGFATPRREFGKQSEIQGRAVPQREDQSVRLPSMVLSRLGWTRSSERTNLVRHRKLRWSDDLNIVTGAQHPIAYDLSYQLDVWTKYRDDANLLVALTLTKFPRLTAPLTVDMGNPWGERRVFLEAKDVGDNTELDPGEDGDREVRHTIDLTLQTWLPLPPKDVRTVRKVVMEADVMWYQDEKGVDAVAFRKTLEEA